MLHWVLWVNTWHDRLYYRHLHGDKDTFALGFALAGAADQYMQVSSVIVSLCNSTAAQLFMLAPTNPVKQRRGAAYLRSEPFQIIAMFDPAAAANCWRCCVQVSVPPGGVFRWGPGQLEVKCAGGSCNTTDGWQLMGALQHDNYAVRCDSRAAVRCGMTAWWLC